MYETIGKKFTGLIQPEIRRRGRVEWAEMRRCRRDFFFYLVCHVMFVGMAVFAYVTERGHPLAWLLTTAAMSTLSTIHAHRGWLGWRMHKERRDVYDTLAQDPNIAVITGHTIARIVVDEEEAEAASESDSGDVVDPGSHDRESAGRSDLPEVPTDNH